ncbi:hypothetical protein JCM16303_003459 [Sporobolomyces ruberrimus]
MSEGNAELATQGVVNLAASNRTTSRVSPTSSSSSRLPTTTSCKENSRSSSSRQSSTNTTSARPSRTTPTPQSSTNSQSRESRSTSSRTRRTSTRPTTRTTRSKSTSTSASRNKSTSGRSSITDISTTSSVKTRSRPKPTTSTSRRTHTKHRSSSASGTTHVHVPPTPTRTTSTPRKTTSRRESKSKSTARPTSTTKTTSRVSSTKASQTRTKETVKPSPTSYGYAPRKGCTEPPPTFEGSAKGFANLCRVRYCDAKPRRNMIWSGLDGDVTREEIESALGMLMQLEPVWENGQGNILGDGAIGQGAYSASLLFEVTGDIRALDVAVRIADNILALQNQNTENPVIIWTGEADPVWPTHDLPPNNKSELVYAGCEQGEIVSNMVNAALMILKSPCLWNKVPPEFDGPTVFNPTATYHDRALAYIAAGDDTYENYFFRFFDSAGSIIQPADGRWWAVGDSRDPGTLMPWNRRMQIVHGALKLAAAHETTAAFNPNVTKYYDSIVQRNVMDFLGALNQTRGRVEDMDIFQWDYSAMEEHTEESKGIHALYDIFGSWLAWQRSSATYYLSNNFGLTMAQTFEYQINLGNGSFAGLVTGESTKKGHTIDSLWGHWSFYGLFLPEWYRTVASSNVDHGFQGRTWLAIPLLWTKHALYANDLTFWTGRYSSGYGYVLGSEGKAASSVVQWGQAAATSPFSFTLLTFFIGVLGVSYIIC